MSGPVIVVSGSGSGIGRALCIVAGRRGMTVVGLDVGDDGGRETDRLVREGGGTTFYYHCDVADTVEVASVFARIAREVGPIDVLVNNAARGSHTTPEDLTVEEWNGVVAVNLTGTVFVSQQAGRSMIAAGRGGSIINLSSIGGVAALGRGNFAYSLTKAGIIGLTRELAIEWAGYGIRVNAIAPSQVNTEGFRLLVGNEQVVEGDILPAAIAGIPLGRLADSIDVVEAILFLASDAATFITGITLPVDGGSLALHPGGSLRTRVSTT
jgi:NAD(P)-dependent dehydrogenase (short-subunit alcohol dehydrogenase family)